MKRFISSNDAEHPARKKSIEILESIAEYMGDETMFDCKKGNTRWYDLEDLITKIIIGGGK
jgi:hypothetical protein